MQVLNGGSPDRSALGDGTVAVIGFGNQGQAHALNLRDSGYRVVVGQRRDGAGHAAAIAHGFTPRAVRDAASAADLVVLSLPDETMPDVYRDEIAPVLRPGQALGFVHGYNIRFGRILPPPNVDVILVAPKGPGRLLRARYEAGRGLAAMIAVHQDASGRAREKALCWAAGIGADRAAIVLTTFDDETEADLFGEQAVLCGGVLELMKAGFDTLVAAGYAPELAYFECVHEVKQIVDLVYEEGLAGMRRRISSTARYGGLTRGPRIVSEAVRADMCHMLEDIRTSRFAEEWTAEVRAGCPRLRSLGDAEAQHAAEAAGRTVREWTAGRTLA